MKTKIALTAVCFLSLIANAQNLIKTDSILTPSVKIIGTTSGFQQNGTSLYYNGGYVGIGTSTPTSILNVQGGEVVFRPRLDGTLDQFASLAIQNYGVNKKMHGWNLMTASYTGAWGVGSNAFEIWEYPDRTSSNVGDATHRRFVIETGRDLYCNPIVIGPKGTLNIGYDRSFKASDINDLSVNGNVGIGTLDTKGYKLAVNGTIKAREIKVESTGWADFVFDENYALPSLEEVASHIKENKHLPGIPSASQVAKEGVNLGEMNAKLLQKIEELTLYTIRQQEMIEAMQEEIKEFKATKNN